MSASLHHDHEAIIPMKALAKPMICIIVCYFSIFNAMNKVIIREMRDICPSVRQSVSQCNWFIAKFAERASGFEVASRFVLLRIILRLFYNFNGVEKKYVKHEKSREINSRLKFSVLSASQGKSIRLKVIVKRKEVVLIFCFPSLVVCEIFMSIC